MTLDPVTVGIAAGRLASILDEQQATLVRTAFSTIVRESEDLACGVFDRAGRMLGQSHSGTPGHINAMATGLRHVVAAYPPETLDPGDVLVTNDPWMTAGQINDLTVVTPVWRDARLIGWFASTCHAPDIGGRLLSAEASDVFEEGLRLPIMKLARAGTMNEELLTLIRANVRTPRETVGDLYAQAAANDVGARSLLRCLEDLELEDLEEVGAEIRRRSEAAMRAAIAKLPDGRYEAVGYSDGHGERIELRLAAIIDGDEITLDFAGSSPQSEHGINVVLNYTHAYASFALKAAVAPGVPHNDGSFTPVHVTAPEGSILNCREPAPVASRHVVGHFVPGRRARRARAGARTPRGRQLGRALDHGLEPAQPDALPVRRRRRLAGPRRAQLQRLPVRGGLRADRGVRVRGAARPARALAADGFRRRREVARRARPDVGDDAARWPRVARVRARRPHDRSRPGRRRRPRRRGRRGVGRRLRRCRPND